MNPPGLSALAPGVKRIEYGGMHVDLIATSSGFIRVGSMPDIVKHLTEYGFREEIVVVPSWQSTLAGDNRTGEEFVLWQAQVRGGIRKRYVGTRKNLTQLHTHLDETFSYFFDPRRISIVKKRWLSRWFEPVVASPEARIGQVTIQVAEDRVIICDQGRTLYDSLDFSPPGSPDELVEEALARIPKDPSARDSLEITPLGTGNGFSGTVAANLVRHATTALLIDPCGYPAHTLARHGIHWDDITHILITHNHEDHIQGFSAFLKQAERKGSPLNLVTAPSIFQLLRKQFTPLCPDFDRVVTLLPVTPKAPLSLGSMEIQCRWNHHFLPYGTLGLRLSAGGRALGFSGDTKLDPKINAVLNREELTPSWFAPCNLVFHEIDFDNPASVHTHWKEVEALQRSIPGRVLGYHTAWLDHAPFPLAEEGRTYSLETI